jgi:hypothetical protein
MKLRILLILVTLIQFSVHAQTQVPNSNFESWTLHEEGIAGGGDYWMPDSGWYENMSNSAIRFYIGRGFFYRYEESDANGYALKLASGGMDGFNRFKCDEVPILLKGRYKFSDNGCDDFTINAYAVNIADTLTSEQLFLGNLHSSAKIFAAPITESFQDFEIDLTEFKDVDIDYFVIMVKMNANGSCVESMSWGDIIKNDPNGFAVIDDLELVYDILTSVNDEFNESDVMAFPNPTDGLISLKINKTTTNAYIRLFDIVGNMLIERQAEGDMTQLDLKNFTPGIYFLHIRHDMNEKTIKIVKQ